MGVLVKKIGKLELDLSFSYKRLYNAKRGLTLS